jgi:RNA polymerase sigma factor (sigma-70 family)
MMTAVGVIGNDELAVYRRHADELIRYATVLVGPDNAGDVVEDAVVRCFASPAWATVTQQRAYLFRAVLNEALMQRRAGQRREAREQRASGPTFVADPQSSVDASVDAHAALARLSGQQRAVVYLTYWDDLTPAQIAELLDVSEGAVRKQLSRARANLREVLR